eukprot:scaffold12808_cov133-Isochrysis_galbana.AAC.5
MHGQPRPRLSQSQYEPLFTPVNGAEQRTLRDSSIGSTTPLALSLASIDTAGTLSLSERMAKRLISD